MKAKMFIVMIAMLVVTTLTSLTVFAKPPYRAQILGAYYESGENPSVKSINIVPVNNNTFGIYSSDQLELCTRLYLYFGAGTNSISNFNIQIKLLSEGYQLNTSANNIAYSRLNNISSSGVISDSITVGSDLRQTYDGNIITWQYIRSSAIDRNGILLVLTFQNFMLGSNPVYFEVLNFTVNGMTAEEIEVAKQSESTDAAIEQASSIMEQSQLMENELYSQIYVPGDETVQMSQSIAALWESNYPMVTLVQGNNIIPVMMTFVFALAFFSFLVFGRKGA